MKTFSATHSTSKLLLWLLLAFSQVLYAQDIASLQTPEESSPSAAKSIIETKESGLPGDDQIETRLKEIYSHLPNLEEVAVEVEDGVVILSGSVEDIEAMESARQLAERAAGAVIVVNKMTRDRSIRARLAAAWNSIVVRCKDLLGNAPLLLLALALVAIAVLIGKRVRKADWLFERMSGNWFVQDLLQHALYLAIVFASVVIALKLLDATAILGSLIGALGIVGLALGFATRDTVENYIASMLLSLRQPFSREDYVSIEGTEGKVLRLTPRATILLSLEGNHLRIPNSKVYKATITNYTRNPLRRFEFKVGVDTEIDLNLPRDLAVSTLNKLPGVLQTPPVQCLVDELGDSSIVLKVLAWIDQRESDFQKTRSEAQQNVKEAFDAAGIIMPEPIYNVNLRRQLAGKKALPSHTEKTPASIEPETVDTSRDQTVEQQIRAEQDEHREEDLLSKNAPSE